MKEAIITDLNGYMIDVTLVADHVTGVFPIKEPPQDSDESNELYMTTGYIIASSVPAGLYKLKFDIEAYCAANERYELDMLQWLKKNNDAEKEQEGDLIEPTPPVLYSFWKEGYTPSELDALLNLVVNSEGFGTFQTPIQIKKTNWLTKLANHFQSILRKN